MRIIFFYEGYGDHRDLHVRTHSFPTRRSSDLGSEPYKCPKDIAKAKQLFEEAGYKGEPITILRGTDHQYINPANLVMIQQLRKAGFLKDRKSTRLNSSH